MFRKIVSNIAFSPALVGQLSFYAKRLRKEELTRRLGLIFTVLALAVQSLAIIAPPEAANAASSSDFVRGGVTSMNQYLSYYDRNSENLRDMVDYIGITRAELVAAKETSINSKDSWISFGRTSPFSAAQGDVTHTYNKTGGGTGTMHGKPLRLWDTLPYTIQNGSNYRVWLGHSAKIGTFAIMANCGNPATKRQPPPPPKPISACSALTVKAASRTEFDITGTAEAKNGARILSYVYKVKNGAGTTLTTKTVTTSATSSNFRYSQTSPGSYTVSLAVNTSEGVKDGANCRSEFTVTPPPVVPAAACTSVKVITVNRTVVQLSGTATATGGAKINKYTFVITNSDGKVIATKTVTSSSASVHVENFTVSTPGTYKVVLTVGTSIGEKTDKQNCEKSFTIVKPAVCPLNESLPANSPDCQPCPGDESIWIKDDDCVGVVIETKTASNITHGSVDATTLLAKASDRISYTVTAENRGVQASEVTLSEKLGDVLEYATLTDTGGGTFNQETQTLTWPALTLAPHQKQSRTFAVQMKSEVPIAATGHSEGSSFDCIMTNTFGNTVSINVDCPTPKVVEQVVSELPKTGATENMIFGGFLFAIVTYFYARSRQLGKEVRLVRRNVSAGAF